MPIKLKLSLVITALLAVTVILLSAMLLRRQQATLTAEMVKRGLTIAQNLAASAKNPLVSDDELTLNLLVKDAMKDPDVAYVAITDEKGKALAHSDVHLIGPSGQRSRPHHPDPSCTASLTPTRMKGSRTRARGRPLRKSQSG